MHAPPFLEREARYPAAMRSLLGGLVLIVVLAFAPAAVADVRYAAPNGDGGFECAKGDPCSLEDAIEEASPGDEVIALAGTYPVFSPIASILGGIWIHGDFGGPMPKLVGATGDEEPAIAILGSRIEYLDISNSAELGAMGVYCSNEGEVNRVRVAAFGSDRPEGIFTFGGCTIRNSLVVAESERAVAVNSTGRKDEAPTRLGNVTAIAHGENSRGLFVTYYTEPEVAGSYTVIARNSIFHGDQADINPSLSFLGPGRVEIGHSNFATTGSSGGEVVDKGGNQSAPPQFVDPAGGNYAEMATSPTIDAGLVEADSGAFDLAGNPRVIGGGIDIGAFEFVPPPPPPPAPLASPSITSLSIKPAAFRVANAGGAFISAKKKPKPKAPVGARVAYNLSLAATVSFAVARKGVGRRVGGKCVKQTKANKAKRRCTRLKPVRGVFTHPGGAGANAFKFSGRIGNKPLSPGSYVLTATTGASSKSAGFKVVR
jgi:hypothetical protein